ncbi:PIG-L family deacetylase [Streptomyces sp. A7024]|uniref:PIG-L family deacetylase n=1 Tax=Streptomyces coryli TaxID=1128680 RepID=A0A6G4TTX2_9ACTN|nr:PIG-L deacetylase family protein [Streptomyces coryli]NGN63469.1 PIG-L family deacetylase [Streptomyces coryli]
MNGTDDQLKPMPEDFERVLAIVAHPDDLEYGAAAAVSHWTKAGKEVTYLLVSRGEAGIDGLDPETCARLREEEQRASAAVVGVSALEFLDHRDGVIEEGLPLRRDIAAAIRRHRPELLVTLNHHDTWGDDGWWNTPDHRAVGRSVLDAAGDAGNRWIFPEQLGAGGLEPWGGVRWVAVAGSPYATHATAVEEADVDAAVASLAEHKAYIEGLGVKESPAEYARGFLGQFMEATGRRLGEPYAVGFQVYPR